MVTQSSVVHHRDHVSCEDDEEGVDTPAETSCYSFYDSEGCVTFNVEVVDSFEEFFWCHLFWGEYNGFKVIAGPVL